MSSLTQTWSPDPSSQVKRRSRRGDAYAECCPVPPGKAEMSRGDVLLPSIGSGDLCCSKQCETRQVLHLHFPRCELHDPRDCSWPDSTGRGWFLPLRLTGGKVAEDVGQPWQNGETGRSWGTILALSARQGAARGGPAPLAGSSLGLLHTASPSGCVWTHCTALSRSAQAGI